VKFEQVSTRIQIQGTILNSQNIMHGEINIRLGSANQYSLYALNNIFKSKRCQGNQKNNNIYLSYVQPLFKYTWAITRGDQKKLRSLEDPSGPILNNI